MKYVIPKLFATMRATFRRLVLGFLIKQFEVTRTDNTRRQCKHTDADNRADRRETLAQDCNRLDVAVSDRRKRRHIAAGMLEKASG